MKICIRRGANEIGGSCVEVVADNGKRILIDLGMPLIDDMEPDHGCMPDIDYDGLSAVLISHPHGDHYMLVPFMVKEVDIYMGEVASAIILAANSYMKYRTIDLEKTLPIAHKKSFTIADTFKVTPYLTDHSAYDSYMFLIEADGKRILYTGDFRMHGRKASLVQSMMSNPPKDIDVMLLEGTNIGNEKNCAPESDIEMDFLQEFKNTKGLVTVQSSCQNIDRLVTVYRAAKRAGRILVLPWNMGLLSMALKNDKIPNFKSFADVKKFITDGNPKKHEITSEKIAQKPEKYVVFLTSSIYMLLEWEGLFNKDTTYIWSLWAGYKKLPYTAGTIAKIKAYGAKIAKDIHTSGHASLSDSKQFAKSIAAKKVIVMHTKYPKQFAKEIPNGMAVKDNEWITV